MLTIKDIQPFLNENKKIGGILKFVENDQMVLSALGDDKKFLTYLLHYVNIPLNHFYFYFLASFEQKLYDAVILRAEPINLNNFSSLIHSNLRNRYIRNVYGDEKKLWNTNGKSLDRTISAFLKNYNPEYVQYLYEKGYKQLAELAMDIYLYYPVFNSEVDFQNFMISYKPFLKNEWKPMNFDNVQPLDTWLYGSYIKEEQIHSIVQM